MRVAFFGGSFDPPHLGHLHVAQAAADRLRLDRVLFAPVALQPLKQNTGQGERASFGDRLRMLELMLGGAADARLEASLLDGPRPDGCPNYTYETILRLRAMLEPDDKVFILVGADALLTLPRWRQALSLIVAADFILVARPGYPAAGSLFESLLALSPSGSLVQAEQPERDVDHLVLQLGSRDCPSSAGVAREAHFYVLADLQEDISATAVRNVLAVLPSDPASTLMPAVARYIQEHGLYRAPIPAKE